MYVCVQTQSQVFAKLCIIMSNTDMCCFLSAGSLPFSVCFVVLRHEPGPHAWKASTVLVSPVPSPAGYFKKCLCESERWFTGLKALAAKPGAT